MAGNDGQRPAQTASTGPRRGELSALLEELACAPDLELPEPGVALPAAGTAVGRYQVLREIGRGGFGAVFEAFDPELGRAVALKMLRPGRRRRELSADSIRQEAEAIARLEHPAIVTVHDVGSSPAGPYLVMELLRGESLARRLARGPLPPGEALRAAEEVAQALAHAHERGVLHRDLKPANVFLTDDGRVKLLDFGLAHLLGLPGSNSGGTPAYMAPEQARGEAVDERADVWAAGMVLGETVAGRRPLAGPGAAAGPGPGEAIPRASAAPRLPGVPRPIARAVADALRPDPAARPRDGREWLERLRSARAALERPRRARRGALLASAGILLGLALAGTATWRVWRRQMPVGRVTVAVADFANETRDPDLDGLSGLLITSLEQSKKLRVLTRSRMWDYLREMGKPAVQRIDEPLAREIGRKADARALLLASVRRMDDLYAVELRALDPERDEYLFTVKESAATKRAIFDLVDRISERTRAELREAPGEVGESQVQVARAVTGSLEAYAHYFRAQQILAESLDSDGARREYLRALERDPDFLLPHLQLAALILLGEAPGDDQDAERHLDAVLRQAGRLPDRERRLARALRATRQFASAEEIDHDAAALYREAVARYPDDKQILAIAAQVAVVADDYRSAAQWLEQALRVDPGYGPALLWLTTVYDKLGRAPEALAAARRAVAARPGPVAQAVVAQALAAIGEREQALAAARKVRESGEAVPFYVSEMLWPVFAYGGAWESAEAELRRWSGPGELPARRQMALSALAAVLHAQGRAAEVRALAAELSRGPAPELARWAAGMADMLAGDTRAAAQAFREAGTADGASVVAYLGDREGAAEMARGLEPGSVPAEIHRAVSAWRGGEPEAALPILEGVLAATGDPGALRYLGEIAFEAGRHGQAADALGRWLRRSPSAVALGWFVFQPRVYLVLARCQERLGRRSEALATLDRFLANWARADAGLPLLAEAREMRRRLGAAPGSAGAAPEAGRGPESR